jgi:DNA-3-methyladenine glycosylase II
MDDATAIQAITALRGFGRWSAEIYLMFSLKRADIFPADDLALRVALGRLKGLEQRPTPGQARALVEHWAPWRSVGALFLWHYYRGAPA